MAVAERQGRREEPEFLPAVLEIQETPPQPSALRLLHAVMLFFAAAAVWAWIGHVDVVATATGHTVPRGGVKVIQPLESAVIRAILVRDGDRVERGQALVELDSTQAAAELEQLRGETQGLLIDQARLQTLLGAADEAASGDALNTLAERLRSQLPADVDVQQVDIAAVRMYSEWREYHAGLAATAAAIAEHRAQYASVQARILQIDAVLPLITERAGAARELADRKLAPRMQWLELEQQRVERVKDREVQVRQLNVTEAAGAGLEHKRAAQVAGYKQKLSEELEQTQRRLAALEQERLKAQERLSLRSLTAPVSGTVQRLAVRTAGGVVTPAQELMHIVPESGPLEIEAWLLNRDIGYVHAGQPAAIKVETFPFTKFGTITGSLRTVATDAVPDERLGPVYAVRVSLSRQSMTVEGTDVPLTPGMAVTVELKLGSRRIFEFILSPLLRYRSEAFRER